jgi:hypothetical protein
MTQEIYPTEAKHNLGCQGIGIQKLAILTRTNHINGLQKSKGRAQK